MSVETVAPSGLEAVQARIAALQSRIGSLAGGRAASAPLSSSAASAASPDSASGTDFSSSLASAVGDATSTDGSDPSPSGTDGSGPAAPATATSGATSTGSASPTADAAIAIAKRYLGIPYRWGGTNPATGLDCSGLTQLVYRQVGVSLPRVAADQAKVGVAVGSLATARPGDLLFFHEPVSHVAIYLGGGRMLEAPHTGANVRIGDVWATPTHIRRVLPGGATTYAATRSGTPYADVFRTEGARANVSPALLAAVAKVESGFRPDATSRAGARGLMQLMPGTARGLGVDPTDPQQAVRGAARLLSTYLTVYSGDLDRALAAYNAGPVAVRQYGGVPPYAETQAYVRKVRAAMSEVSV